MQSSHSFWFIMTFQVICDCGWPIHGIFSVWPISVESGTFILAALRTQHQNSDTLAPILMSLTVLSNNTKVFLDNNNNNWENNTKGKLYTFEFDIQKICIYIHNPHQFWWIQLKSALYSVYKNTYSMCDDWMIQAMWLGCRKESLDVSGHARASNLILCWAISSFPL